MIPKIFDTQGSAGHSNNILRFILCSTDKVEPPKSKKVKAGIVAGPRVDVTEVFW